MLPTTKSATGLSRILLPGIPPGVGAMLAALILDPEMSINPYFWTILLGGLVILTLSLYSFLSRKRGWLAGIWQVAGVSVAGYVLVSWAMYSSFPSGVMMQALVITLISIAGAMSGTKIRRFYGKRRRLVHLALLICVLFPLTAIVPRVGATPTVIVSPSEKFVTLRRSGMTTDITVTVKSVYSSVWDFRMSADATNLLAVYLDGVERGPTEIPFLDTGRQSIVSVRIESSPLIKNGTYEVDLNYTYKDAFQNAHLGSTGLQVLVGYGIAPACIIATVAFGSELSPEVVFLRDFRDRLVMSTVAGSAFMRIFNDWYYSFSPAVARVIANNEPLRALTRITLYPLIGILYLSAFTYSVFNRIPELAVVMAGILSSSLIGLAYISVPIFLTMKLVGRNKRVRLAKLARYLLMSPLVGLTVLAGGEYTQSFLLLAVGGSLTVLGCMFTAPAITVIALSKLSHLFSSESGEMRD
ncbi:MAG: CFI-box-CTERM domain-containing protein [Candidatus Bathyarchaeia archaeon]